MGPKNKIILLTAALLVVVVVFSWFKSSQDGESIIDVSSGGSDIESVVKRVIKENPKLILESVSRYQREETQRQMAALSANVADKKQEIQRDPDTPVAGNPNGDVTVVEFFDYACGYCRNVLPVVTKLLEEDGNVRFVLKELPILGQRSDKAARAALAVFKTQPDKYFAVHQDLMKERFSDEAAIMKVVSKHVSDIEAIKTKMQSDEISKIIEKNRLLARDVGIQGTPAFIVGEELIRGAVGIEALKEKIAAARGQS